MYSTFSRSDVFFKCASSAGAAAKKYLPISFTHGDGDLVLAARMEANDAWEAVQTGLAVASWFVEEIDGDAFFIEFDHPPAILVKKVPLEPQKLGGGQYTAFMTGVDLLETLSSSMSPPTPKQINFSKKYLCTISRTCPLFWHMESGQVTLNTRMDGSLPMQCARGREISSFDQKTYSTYSTLKTTGKVETACQPKHFFCTSEEMAGMREYHNGYEYFL